jgi:hypothetical protein
VWQIWPMVSGSDRIPRKPCARCGHLTRVDKLRNGYGPECAAMLGLTGTTVDVGQTGPDLFDLLDKTADLCDGWDR